MIHSIHRLFILIYVLSIACNATLEQPVEQPDVAQLAAEKDPIPPIYNTPPQPPVKILREASPITEKESMQVSDDLQQSSSYTYSYYRPLYYPGVYYSYYPGYRLYRPFYYYNWWYY